MSEIAAQTPDQERPTEALTTSAPAWSNQSDPGPVASLSLALLRRLLWAAKASYCSCIQSAGVGYGTNGERRSWVGQKHECPRCKAIREVQEVVPDVI